MFCRFKSCGKCSGDLALDGDEWCCVQCGQRYYPSPLLTGRRIQPPLSGSLPAPAEEEEKLAPSGRHHRRWGRIFKPLIWGSQQFPPLGDKPW